MQSPYAIIAVILLLVIILVIYYGYIRNQPSIVTTTPHTNNNTNSSQSTLPKSLYLNNNLFISNKTFKSIVGPSNGSSNYTTFNTTDSFNTSQNMNSSLLNTKGLESYLIYEIVPTNTQGVFYGSNTNLSFTRLYFPTMTALVFKYLNETYAQVAYLNSTNYLSKNFTELYSANFMNATYSIYFRKQAIYGEEGTSYGYSVPIYVNDTYSFIQISQGFVYYNVSENMSQNHTTLTLGQVINLSKAQISLFR